MTIGSIAVHAAWDKEGSWTTIATPNETVNLLALANGVRQQMALVAPASVGTVAITITGAVTDTPVTLSIRRKLTFDGTDVMVEIKTINVVNADPGSFSFPVGAGIHSVAASTAGKATQVSAFDVTANTTTAVPIAF